MTDRQHPPWQNPHSGRMVNLVSSHWLKANNDYLQTLDEPRRMARFGRGDSWNLSHLGYLYPGTTPVMIKLDHMF